MIITDMFLKNQKYAIMSQQWYLPRGYSKSPPDGRYVLWSVCIPWPCKNYQDLWPADIKNYTCYLSFGTTKRKTRFSSAAKATIRKQRLVARVSKKMPLFADQAVQKQIAAKPDYFDPDKIALTDIEHRRLIEKAEHDMDMQYYPG